MLAVCITIFLRIRNGDHDKRMYHETKFNKLLLVKMALSDGAQDASLAKIAGCPVWAVKNYKAQCRGYSMAQLKDIVENCQDMDYKLKTGQVMDNAAMEVMIVELCEMQ